jgi:hypothetical protein
MSYQGIGQDAAIVAPPPTQQRDWMMVLGWGLVVATATGIFWGVTSGPVGRVTANPRRRRTSKRRRSSRRRRRSRRNPREKLPSWMNKVIYWGRNGNSYYAQAPNEKVRLYRGKGGKQRAEDQARSLAKRYGLPKRRDDGRLNRKYWR